MIARDFVGCYLINSRVRLFGVCVFAVAGVGRVTEGEDDGAPTPLSLHPNSSGRSLANKSSHPFTDQIGKAVGGMSTANEL